MINQLKVVPLYFDPKRIGKSMAKHSSDLIQTENNELSSRWYKGSSETELFIWEDPLRSVIKFQINFCGQVVEWNIVEGVKTGYLIEEEVFEKTVVATETVHYDKEFQVNTVKQVISLIENMKCIETVEIESLVYKLDNNQSMDTMSHDQFLTDYSATGIQFSRSKFISGIQILFYKLKKIFSKNK